MILFLNSGETASFLYPDKAPPIPVGAFAKLEMLRATTEETHRAVLQKPVVNQELLLTVFRVYPIILSRCNFTTSVSLSPTILAATRGTKITCMAAWSASPLQHGVVFYFLESDARSRQRYSAQKGFICKLNIMACAKIKLLKQYTTRRCCR